MNFWKLLIFPELINWKIWSDFWSITDFLKIIRIAETVPCFISEYEFDESIWGLRVFQNQCFFVIQHCCVEKNTKCQKNCQAFSNIICKMEICWSACSLLYQHFFLYLLRCCGSPISKTRFQFFSFFLPFSIDVLQCALASRYYVYCASLFELLFKIGVVNSHICVYFYGVRKVGIHWYRPENMAFEWKTCAAHNK